MSCNLSTNGGSAEGLKVSDRWGGKPKAVQILRAVLCDRSVPEVSNGLANEGRPLVWPEMVQEI